MEIEVGEYARTIDGEILQILEIKKYVDRTLILTDNRAIRFNLFK